MEKAVFEAKDGSGANDGRLRENATYNFLTSSLPVVSIEPFRRFDDVTG